MNNNLQFKCDLTQDTFTGEGQSRTFKCPGL